MFERFPSLSETNEEEEEEEEDDEEKTPIATSKYEWVFRLDRPSSKGVVLGKFRLKG
ncbi:hypothetical protein PVK06_039379 [Gossypium arboreum]|uniref:Uncharacterized protein n=1 Tax=Gossypium arboreum TaxID=29729 RepID=A0ABR0N3A0_GOSAR|nr:hypothetical protein PVK06_039379 [Gossypium arboreum]